MAGSRAGDRTTLTLAAGGMRLVLAPGIGGAVDCWERDGVPILRPKLPGALASGTVRGLGAYPLVPYSNRIAEGRFTFRGTRYSLPTPFGPHAIHGVGWQRAWQAERDGAAAARLTLDHAVDGDWPFRFRAEQDFALAEDRLTLTMRIRNTGDVPEPAGLGWHPYFPRDGASTLQFAADHVWVAGADLIPALRTTVPPEWDHTGGKPLGSAPLDNCFAGWRGRARIAYRERGFAVALKADPVFRHLVVFVPLAFPFCAVEPVTNMNDGINRMDGTAEHGVCVLAPGETLAGRMVFHVEALPTS